MLLNIDGKQLEWVTAIYWSQDPVAMTEIITGFDQHADNQKRFKLPSRVIAKIFLFRVIFGGSGFSFANDAEFGYLGSESWWDEKIAQFYEKYKGLHAWGEQLYQRVVINRGRLDLPTGRTYQFEPFTNRNHEVRYPKTKILNYPVQGLAAELMAIARVSLAKRLSNLEQYGDRRDGILFVNTVHDSIVLDLDESVWYNIGMDIVAEVKNVFEDIPENFRRLFGIEFNLPVRCEITHGPDWANMKEVA